MIAPPRQDQPQDWRDRFFRARDGLRLYYREYGDAASERAPVLCLGGLTRNSLATSTWRGAWPRAGA